MDVSHVTQDSLVDIPRTKPASIVTYSSTKVHNNIKSGVTSAKMAIGTPKTSSLCPNAVTNTPHPPIKLTHSNKIKKVDECISPNPKSFAVISHIRDTPQSPTHRTVNTFDYSPWDSKVLMGLNKK